MELRAASGAQASGFPTPAGIRPAGVGSLSVLFAAEYPADLSSGHQEQLAWAVVEGHHQEPEVEQEQTTEGDDPHAGSRTGEGQGAVLQSGMRCGTTAIVTAWITVVVVVGGITGLVTKEISAAALVPVSSPNWISHDAPAAIWAAVGGQGYFAASVAASPPELSFPGRGRTNGAGDDGEVGVRFRWHTVGVYHVEQDWCTRPHVLAGDLDRRLPGGGAALEDRTG